MASISLASFQCNQNMTLGNDCRPYISVVLGKYIKVVNPVVDLCTPLHFFFTLSRQIKFVYSTLKQDLHNMRIYDCWTPIANDLLHCVVAPPVD